MIRLAKTLSAALLFSLAVPGARATVPAPELGAAYTTELQSDFGDRVNWNGLLELSFGIDTWENGRFDINTIHVYRTSNNPIIPDKLTFSNIEEENIPVNIFVAGFTQEFRRGSIFAGIRNMNEDYFIGRYESFFTNSSCGINPTVSIDYPVANYPVTALGLHGLWTPRADLEIRGSLYNGVAGSLTGPYPRLLRLNPRNDGYTIIGEAKYILNSGKYGNYSIGGIVRHSPHGNLQRDAEMEKEKKVNYSLWGSLQQELFKIGTRSFGVLVQGSVTPEKKYADCYGYAGAGLLLTGVFSPRLGDTLGVFVQHGWINSGNETALEVTWAMQVREWFAVQPAFHYIRTSGQNNYIGMLRLSFAIGN